MSRNNTHQNFDCFLGSFFVKNTLDKFITLKLLLEINVMQGFYFPPCLWEYIVSLEIYRGEFATLNFLRRQVYTQE